MKRSVTLAALAAHCLFNAAHAAAPEPAAFTADVAQRMRAALPGQQVEILQPLRLRVGSLRVGLDTPWRTCTTAEASCDEELQALVGAVKEALAREGKLPDKAALEQGVRLAVRPAEYATQVGRMLGAQGVKLVTAPLAADLVVIAVLDTPQATRPVTSDDLARTGLDAAAVLALARANTDREVPPLAGKAAPVEAGQIQQLTLGYYTASRLAFAPQWEALAQAQHGALLVMAPAPDLLLYSAGDTPAGIDALRTYGANLARRAPKPLSDQVLRWTPAGWQAVR
ncbi:hypothetical protein IP92_02722 [Pseudoduganella flava]|uniref:DUF2066 domain-containing protein n=1 Tax=Pseudoduganella flava TaxID=871742 RepID=A0A562PT90_9BURK|nr:hypothetical protein [Pseudoduganella flava]QGZ39061.1 hypothetical protein GO485_08395 [Pseudoduganella flava]TWI47662.1 hypothetical protein IP92_02722 [Pseudoduganella flava]